MASCRLCGGRSCEPIGTWPPVPLPGYLVDTEAEALAAERFAITIAWCPNCRLVQHLQDEIVERLLTSVYAHYHPTTLLASPELRGSSMVIDRSFELSASSPSNTALDVGANDGALLSVIASHGLQPIGVDPAITHLESAATETSFTAGSFRLSRAFDRECAREILTRFGAMRLIILRHTLEHLPNPVETLRLARTLLAPEGCIALEVPSLRSQTEHGHLESFSAQHLSHFTAETLTEACRRAGLAPRESYTTTSDGGSIAIIAKASDDRHRSELPSELQKLIGEERSGGVHERSYFERNFAHLSDLREKLSAVVDKYLAGGKTIGLYGAGGKGQYLTNLLSLWPPAIRFAVDIQPAINGRFIPGSGVKVVAPHTPEARELEIFLITAPTHLREILSREKTRLFASRTVYSLHPTVHPVLARD